MKEKQDFLSALQASGVQKLVPTEALDMQRRFEEQQVARGALRMLVAAHLHRLEQGAFPAEAAALEARLGGELPRDPFRPGGAVLSYRLEGETLRVWSWGRDQDDDDGIRPRPGVVSSDDPDLTWTTQVPE